MPFVNKVYPQVWCSSSAWLRLCPGLGCGGHAAGTAGTACSAPCSWVLQSFQEGGLCSGLTTGLKFRDTLLRAFLRENLSTGALIRSAGARAGQAAGGEAWSDCWRQQRHPQQDLLHSSSPVQPLQPDASNGSPAVCNYAGQVLTKAGTVRQVATCQPWRQAGGRHKAPIL